MVLGDQLGAYEGLIEAGAPQKEDVCLFLGSFHLIEILVVLGSIFVLVVRVCDISVVMPEKTDDRLVLMGIFAFAKSRWQNRLFWQLFNFLFVLFRLMFIVDFF